VRDLPRLARSLARTNSLEILVTHMAYDVVCDIVAGRQPLATCRGGRVFYYSDDACIRWDSGIRTAQGNLLRWVGDDEQTLYSVVIGKIECLRANAWDPERMDEPDARELLFMKMDRMVWGTPDDHIAFKHIHDHRREYYEGE
jgi:hypothetical protein